MTVTNRFRIKVTDKNPLLAEQEDDENTYIATNAANEPPCRTRTAPRYPRRLRKHDVWGGEARAGGGETDATM